MIVHLSGVGYKGLRLDDLNMSGLLIPKITKDVSRGLQKRGSLIRFSLLHQSLGDKHSGFLH